MIAVIKNTGSIDISGNVFEINSLNVKATNGTKMMARDILETFFIVRPLFKIINMYSHYNPIVT